MPTPCAGGSIIGEPCLAVTIAAGTPCGGFAFTRSCFGTAGIRWVWAGSDRYPPSGASGERVRRLGEGWGVWGRGLGRRWVLGDDGGLWEEDMRGGEGDGGSHGGGGVQVWTT